MRSIFMKHEKIYTTQRADRHIYWTMNAEWRCLIDFYDRNNIKTCLCKWPPEMDLYTKNNIEIKSSGIELVFNAIEMHGYFVLVLCSKLCYADSKCASNKRRKEHVWWAWNERNISVYKFCTLVLSHVHFVVPFP